MASIKTRPATVVQGIRTGSNLLLVVLFLAAIMVPLAGLNRSGVDRMIAQSERRAAAAFPKLELRWHGPILFPKKQSMRVFPHGFETWFNDHVGGRRHLIQAYNLAKVCGLTAETYSQPAVGMAAQSPVIIGREGWLFWTGEFLLEDFRRTRPFSAEELGRWKAVLEARHDWLARRGVQYLLFIAPNQQEIYSEFMPRAINRVGARSRFDQLKAALAGSRVTLVDPRAALMAAKSHELTYFKTDTHWNEFGAYIGYREICAALSPRLPGLKPMPLDDFTMSVRDDEGLYVATLVDSLVPFRERQVTLTPKHPRLAKTTSLHGPSGSRGSTAMTQPQAELPSAIFLNDSFMQLLGPYLGEHWRYAEMIWHDDFPADYLEEVIRRERPTVLVQEFVERKLMRIKPTNPPQVEAEVRSYGVAQKTSDLTR